MKCFEGLIPILYAVWASIEHGKLFSGPGGAFTTSEVRGRVLEDPMDADARALCGTIKTEFRNCTYRRLFPRPCPANQCRFIQTHDTAVAIDDHVRVAIFAKVDTISRRLGFA